MSRAELENLEGPVLDVLRQTDGPVWDVGCNVGLFSIYCARQGRPVTAFDISDASVRLLDASAARNQLPIRTVATALSVAPLEFIAPRGAHTMNTINGQLNGARKQSITVEEAARRFGVPRLIKMDIEGAELDFFRSPEFKTWLIDHQINLLVELHTEEARRHVWPDLPVKELDSRHVLIAFARPPGA